MNDCRTTREILYQDFDDHIMAAKYLSQGDTFKPGGFPRKFKQFDLETTAR